MPCSATEQREERGRGNGGGVSSRDKKQEKQKWGGGAKKLSEDERIERRGDGKPNQFSLTVISIRGQSQHHTAPISSFLEMTQSLFLLLS